LQRRPDRKAGYVVARWRHVIATPAVTQIKDRAKSIKFASACDNWAKARGKLLLYFRSKSEKGSLKIANPELYNQRRGAPGSGFAKKSGALLVSAKPLVKNGAQPVAVNIAGAVATAKE
jgi:hypothetical protein